MRSGMTIIIFEQAADDFPRIISEISQDFLLFHTLEEF